MELVETTQTCRGAQASRVSMPVDTPRPSPRCSKEGMVAQTCTFLKLAGEKLPIEVDPNAHTGFRGFENAVLAELPV